MAEIAVIEISWWQRHVGEDIGVDDEERVVSE
jgi:hypothetical protein